MRAVLLLALVACALVAVSAQSTGRAGDCPTDKPALSDSICDRFTNTRKPVKGCSSDPGAEFETVEQMVVKACQGPAWSTTLDGKTESFQGLFNTPSTKGFFNGDVKYRADAPNYAAGFGLGELYDRMTRFFGSSAMLKCSATNFATYVASRGTQNAIHKNMNITKVEFTEFNRHFRGAAAVLGMEAADLSSFESLLNAYARDSRPSVTHEKEICTQAGCPCVPGVIGDNCDGVSSASLASVSFVALAFAALVALLARQ